jgi:exodeoxyribonuclease VII small subunit
MNAKKPTEKSYRELSDELDAVMAHLQADDLDVDEAIEQYEKGMTLVGQLTDYLKARENQLTRLPKADG